MPVPLHTALYRLVKAKEESWSMTPHPRQPICQPHQEGAVRRARQGGASRGALVAALAARRGVAAATAAAPAAKPIVIGWAFDGKGAMAPFDDPALAAAKIRVKQINAKGGVNGPQARDHHLRHAEQQRRRRRSRAR